MKEGLLWYDNQKNVDLKERISSAVKYFENKYGYLPEICYINPITMGKEIEQNESIKVIPNDRVILNHFWLEFSTD
jgi:hypothetical protein